MMIRPTLVAEIELYPLCRRQYCLMRRGAAGPRRVAWPGHMHAYYGRSL
jgi:hypothetical protein